MRLTAEFLLVAVVWFCVGWAVAWKAAYYAGWNEGYADGYLDRRKDDATVNGGGQREM